MPQINLVPADSPNQSAAGAGDDALLDALRSHFGFPDFQPGQRAVIEDVLAGHPTLAVMPTGAGKSLCYQLPGLLLGQGLTLVVSPLISLMKDQVDGLQARGVAAASLNSALDPGAQRAVLTSVSEGRVRVLYVAPERFRHDSFLRALRAVELQLFAIDEAHCISRWGHDFRPDYQRLAGAIEALRPPRLLACTATATPRVRADITRALGVDAPRVHVAGFLRPNLYLEARTCGGERDRLARLRAVLLDPGLGGAEAGGAIVYAGTRKRVEQLTGALRAELGVDQVVGYHAGMPQPERIKAQERFMSGAARIAIATNAFGMGVDRSDVRAVVHAGLPRTVEDYYQEVGRAGRDGAPASCVLLYSPADLRLHEFLIDAGHPAPEVVDRVWRCLRSCVDRPLDTAAIKLGGRIDSEAEADACLRLLTEVRAVRFSRAGWRIDPQAPAELSALGIDFERVARHRQAERGKLLCMKRYMHHPGCRHAFVLDYFGETWSQRRCPGCDRCQGRRAGRASAPTEIAPEADALIVRQALAGVARSGGRFGLRKVAGMLAGSKAAPVLQARLDRLSTYGLLSKLGVEGCAALLRGLVDHDLCQIAGELPLLAITKAGWEVMQARRPVRLRVPPRQRRARRSTRERPAPGQLDPGQLDPDQIERLRALRGRLASEGRVPPYVVFTDKTLYALAAAQPTDREACLAVPGIGPTRWARYGDAILAALGG